MADFNFNPEYGDLSITRNDIVKLPTLEQDTVQRLIMYFKTNKNDYKYSPDWGLNLDRWIGQGITTQLADEIKSKIIEGINTEFTHLLVPPNPEVLYIIDKNIIYYRIVIAGMSTISLSFVKNIGFKSR